MKRLNLQLFADPTVTTAADATAGADNTPATDQSAGNTGAQNDADKAGDQTQDNQGSDTSVEALTAKIARLEADAAKQKAALDKATHEAAESRKALKAKMTQEEIDAQEKQEAAEKTAKELDDLRREVAKGKTVKSVMGKLGLDEEAAGNLADHLFGAADIDNALLEIQKAWQAKEKALRLEFGKIPGPGTGADSNSPEAQAIRRAAEFGKAKNAVNEQAQKAMNAYIR